MNKLNYYAAIQPGGPAFGIGTTISATWIDASKYCDDFQGLVVKQITEASYQAILDGDPNAYVVDD